MQLRLDDGGAGRDSKMEILFIFHVRVAECENDRFVLSLSENHVPIKECLKCQQVRQLRHRGEVKGMTEFQTSRSIAHGATFIIIGKRHETCDVLYRKSQRFSIVQFRSLFYSTKLYVQQLTRITS